MTIDEAIAHYEWAAESAIGEVADESKQMAEWLKQARDAESRVQELEEENTELRKLAQEAIETTGNLLDDLSDLDKELGIEV